MKTALFLLVFLCSLTTAAQNIVITPDAVLINGIPLDSTSLIGDYVELLGMPDRVEELANNIYVYDSLGLYIYESRFTGEVVEISFDFRKNREYVFSPRKRFKGRITFPGYGMKLSRRTNYRKLRRACKRDTNTSLQREFGDYEVVYGDLLLMFEPAFLGIGTRNFTIDFRPLPR